MTDGRQKQTLRIASASIAAILEKHKEGMSARKIAELFRMSGPQTVLNIINEVSKNPESGKLDTPEVSTPTVPMTSTEDRPETREDARS